MGQESRSEVLGRVDAAARSELYQTDGSQVGVGTKIDGKLLSDVASLKVLPATFAGAVAATQQLTAEAVDANAKDTDVASLVIWTTSNAAVATVDEWGKITAIGAGTCTITGTLSKVALGSHTDTCAVTIT